MCDVAKLADVSAMTVSRALRNPNAVTAGTLKRIETAIGRTGYVPNRIAGSLASRRTNVVGLIVPNLHNPIAAETIRGISEILGAEFHLMIAESGFLLKTEEAAVIAFLSQRVCGIVLHNTKHTPRTRQSLQDAEIPCIETGNLTAKPIDMAVGFSNRDAASAMTEYLVARGYRRIGFVSLPLKDNDRASERRHGYLSALAKHGIKAHPERILEAAPGLRSGGQALVRLVESGTGVDAAFLTGDVLATGALLEANRRGWKIPGQIAIAGSDDTELQECILPSMTTIRFPRYEMGRRAASMLLDRLHSRARGSSVLDLGFEIIQRASA
jgi:LacI family gluconate utilization system Gnt-I transcriptional repressor